MSFEKTDGEVLEDEDLRAPEKVEQVKGQIETKQKPPVVKKELQKKPVSKVPDAPEKNLNEKESENDEEEKEEEVVSPESPQKAVKKAEQKSKTVNKAPEKKPKPKQKKGPVQKKAVKQVKESDKENDEFSDDEDVVQKPSKAPLKINSKPETVLKELDANESDEKIKTGKPTTISENIIEVISESGKNPVSFSKIKKFLAQMYDQRNLLAIKKATLNLLEIGVIRKKSGEFTENS